MCVPNVIRVDTFLFDEEESYPTQFSAKLPWIRIAFETQPRFAYNFLFKLDCFYVGLF